MDTPTNGEYTPAYLAQLTADAKAGSWESTKLFCLRLLEVYLRGENADAPMELYRNNEFDSNLTLFEYLGNTGRLAVRASDEERAGILLFVLRVFLDNNTTYCETVLESYFDDTERVTPEVFTLEEYLSYISGGEIVKYEPPKLENGPPTLFAEALSPHTYTVQDLIRQLSARPQR